MVMVAVVENRKRLIQGVKNIEIYGVFPLASVSFR